MPPAPVAVTLGAAGKPRHPALRHDALAMTVADRKRLRDRLDRCRPQDGKRQIPPGMALVAAIASADAVAGQYRFFAKRVGELTNGRVNIEVFPSNQLGAERERIEGLQMGTLDFTKGNEGYGSTFNTFAFIDLKNVLFDKWLAEGGYESYKKRTGNKY